eukprot:TRINITY_DN26998_c0_g1_i1.p2 TRINITY_DN26998_c0_g1~~TRINITY_DN26998_c0_g1_i1.p2  ORF type:complete len:194 (+),score=22.54 TRINITY_DN26998_c0_g1_i1:181-762(+)
MFHRTQAALSDLISTRGGTMEGMSDYRRERYVRYWVDRWARPVKWMVAGAVMGICADFFYDRKRELAKMQGMVYTKRGDKCYQIVGYAWDQRMKDFNVVYRPLFHHKGYMNADEAHLLGTAPISYFEELVPYHKLDPASKERVLPGPFTLDPDWTHSEHLHSVRGSIQPRVIPSEGQTLSGHGTCSHATYKSK